MEPRLATAVLLLTVFASSGAQAQTFSPWTVTPIPPRATRSAFLDVSAASATDAWAVGYYDSTYLGNAVTYTLAMHWDGSAWTEVSTPSPLPTPLSQTTNVQLNTVSVVSSSDVWAAGNALTQVGGGGVFGQWVHFQHWDGAAWSVVPALAPTITTAASGTFVHDSVAFASDDVWFGGAWLESGPIGSIVRRPLAAHWNGTSMTVFPTPVIPGPAAPDGFAIAAFSPLAPDDIWAVCRDQGATGASTLTVILHWDGNAWTLASAPSTTLLHRMRTIVARSPTDVWAFGSGFYSPYPPYVLHYNGSTWSVVGGAPRANSGIAVDAVDMLLGVDSTITHYDGATAVAVESFPGLTSPSLSAFAAEPSGMIFAVGAQFTTASPPTRPLAAVLFPPPSPVAQAILRTPCTGTAPAQSLIATTLPTLGRTLTLCAGDPTGIAQLTPLTTQCVLLLSFGPAATPTCGIPIPSAGPGTSTGELFVDLGHTFIGALPPIPFANPTQPICYSFQLPLVSSLAGGRVFVQAAFLDPVGPSSPGVLSDALEIILGY